MKFEALKIGQRLKRPDLPGIVVEVVHISEQKVELAALGHPASASYYAGEFDQRFEEVPQVALRKV